MRDFFTPWFVLTALLAVGIAHSGIFILYRKDKSGKTVHGSDVYDWIGGHMAAILLVSVAAIYAVWFLEHGSPWTKAAEPFLYPTIYVLSGIFWNWVRKRRSAGSAKV